MTRVVALSGGVGGARLVRGLARVLPPERLTVVVNTGDDFEHWGLLICPDLDTVTYTLAGLSHEEQGWGLAGESFHALAAMRRLGQEDWFALGDADLATHLARTQAWRRGEPLHAITAALAAQLGVGPRLLPMSDEPCPTRVVTEAHGVLSFQQWLVRHRAPAVREILIPAPPPPAPGLLEALADAELVLVGPSNPYVSIDPILSRPGVRQQLAGKPVLALSPLVGGAAVKGPLAEMMLALTGAPASQEALVAHYGGLLTGLALPAGERCEAPLALLPTDTLMRNAADSERLARELLRFAERAS